MLLLRSPYPSVVDGGGSPAEWEFTSTPLISGSVYGYASIVYDSGTYYAYVHTTSDTIKRYTSADGLTWTDTGTVLSASQAWENSRVGVPQVWKEGSTWYMLYRGGTSTNDAVGLATSSDGITWSKEAGNPVFKGASGTWEGGGAEATGPIKVGSTYYVYYEAGLGSGRKVGIATSADLISWAKDARNPIFTGGVFCPFVFRFSGLYYMLLPRYTTIGNPNRGVLDLYRSPRPTFYPKEREYLGTIYASNDHSPLVVAPDTPWVVHADIIQSERVQSGLKVYFATGQSEFDGLYLLEHDDPATALSLLEGWAYLESADADWNEGTLSDVAVHDDDLVLGLDETAVIAQETETATGSNIGSNDKSAVGNSFTPAEAMSGVVIEALINVTGTPNYPIWCRVYLANASNLPTGSPLAEAGIMHTASGWARFEFPDLELAAGTQYVYAVEIDIPEASNIYAVRATTPSVYAGGHYTYYQTSTNTWQKNTSYDAAFRVRRYKATGGTGSGTFESQELDLSPAGTASGTTRISWDADTDADTSVSMEVALSADGGSSWGSYQSVTNGGTIPGIAASADLSDYRLKYRATLTSSDTGKTPRLNQVLVEVESQ